MGTYTISTDEETEELIKKLRDSGINISEFVRNAFKKAINVETSLKDKITFLTKVIDDLNSHLSLLQQRYQEEEAEQQARADRLVKLCDPIPELQQLPQNVLENSQKLMILIDVLREKYPDLRISIKDIKDYYELKKINQ